jgi:prepilin-type N-terminal cleavage/methylation domain-containing protein
MVKKAERAITRILSDRGIANGGFTLFELVVVLSLLGFMLLLAFPNFRDLLGPRDMKRAVLGFMGALRYAQSQAAVTKQNYRLMMEVKENTYWLSVEQEKGEYLRDDSSWGSRRTLPAGIHFLDVIHPELGKIREGIAHVEFSPTGWAEACTIHLQKTDQEIFTIFIHPLGGKIDATSGYVEKGRG